jgi:4-carboxymuconolactone decarboxylase
MSEPRIPLFSTGEIPEKQREVFERIITGPRKALVGPLRAALHNPELADRWQALGQVLRYETSLPAKLNELAILVTGRHWNSELEWTIHAQEARSAGLDPEIISAIRACQVPKFNDEDEMWVYEYSRDLLARGQVEDDTHRAIFTRWGEAGVVELTAVIGYYSMVAMTLNAHRIPLPDDVAPELNSNESGLTRLPSAISRQ